MSNGVRRRQSGVNRCQMVSDGVNRCQMGSDGVKVVLICVKWCQGSVK